MFTGLVQKKGTFVRLSGRSGASVIEVACDSWPDDPLVCGESVAVQGACLTVVTPSEKGFTADVLDETLRCTALGRLRKGDAVNLERALRPTDRLGGHIVSGHVDGTGVIRSISRAGRDHVLRITCAGALLRYISHKGSIAIDGISLTVSALPAADAFEVCIIPTTWRDTSLGGRSAGEGVNLEVDVIARYVERLFSGGRVGGASPGMTVRSLEEAGFQF